MKNTKNANKTALITGITGQDGAYLADFLLAKGYVVHGIKRRTSLFNTQRIDHLYRDPHDPDRRFVLHYGDMTDSSSLTRIIQQTQPDEIYNLAAQSHVAVSFEEPEYTANSDALGTLRVLEAIRILGLDKKTRFYQASTSELFGLVRETPQKETTPFYPRSPYGVAKLYAHWITVNYREAYGLFACNGILFNHECVAADTPILCRVNGVVDVKLPGELVALRRKGPSSQLFESPGLEVWDGQDWTPVVGISATRRRVGEPEHAMIAVQARAGIVGSTAHHRFVAVRASSSLAVVGSRQGSLSDEEEVEVEARAVRPGNSIKLAARLPGTPGFARLAPEMAEFLGLIAADGYVPESVRTVAQFTNNDPRLREHVAALWSRLFLGESRAAEGSSGFSERRVGQLYLSGAGRSVTAWLRDQLYTEDGFKRVPALILNSPLHIQGRFLEGYYAGDGLKAGKGDSVKTNSAVLAQGLYWLYANQGRLGSVYLEQRNGRAYYQINLPSANPLGDKGAHLRREASEVRRIDPVCPTDDQWVFDLETASGVFMAGVGRTIVHNSPLRGETFVTRKVTRALARIALGVQDCLYVGNLNARRDWGHAKDYVRVQWLMLQQSRPEDYVIATGVQRSVRDFVNAAAAELGLELAWSGKGAKETGNIARTSKRWKALKPGQTIVRVDPRYYRPSEVDTLLGDASKAKKKLGWKPQITFKQLVSEMVREDLSLAKRDELARRHGHKVFDGHE